MRLAVHICRALLLVAATVYAHVLILVGAYVLLAAGFWIGRRWDDDGSDL